MLKEFAKVRQVDNGYRRLFSDEDIDLYVWYDNSKKDILGFQLVYGKKKDDMRAFSWEPESGASHTKVDESGWYNPTPILVSDGIFEKNNIAEQFKAKSKSVDKEIVNLVLNTIDKFDINK